MKSAEINPFQVANWFIANTDYESGDVMTHLKLQKLLYYSHAWYLALYDEPLFSEQFEAWSHGPVLRSVYNEFKAFGFDPLTVDEEVPPIKNETLLFHLSEILRYYGGYSAKALEKMTHEENPWRKTRGNLPLEARCEKEIDNDLIKEYFDNFDSHNAK